ncbi:MAG: type IIL restriction-modification enzyme MmeI [Hyphomonadaceae bacterium]|nr:type IIL restriction-modification enzyme MmeI [Hyphomonadaceae bacterium]
MTSAEAFIAKWKSSHGAERANYVGFLYELCDVLGVDRPDASIGGEGGDYTFERPVRPRESADTSNPKRIDLYKRDCFILEAKQSRLPGSKNALPGQMILFNEAPQGERTAQRGWDVMMRNARKQAEGYVFLLEASHKAPPFIIVCDVGHCLELYADFTGTGRAYTQFPDRNGYRIFLDDLRDAKPRDLLKSIWTNPHALDPARKAVRVTRGIAAYLAEVSKALEERGNHAEDVAHFLMRCLFTMFAEDTGLLPKTSFRELLRKCVETPEIFPRRLKRLWSEMESGVDISEVLDARIRHFNGGLFKNTTVFELRREEIGVLMRAAEADWREVDPAIFGTLLEQALNPAERKKLGAHYTPRAYVQRLVEVTVMAPMRADWEAALTKAELAKEDGKDDDAVAIIRGFLDQLTHTRVLDPACGTGNFLYVALELMKQLEGEVLETLTKLGDEQGLLTFKNLTVDPHLFLGLERNPRAAAIAELVVWIGYLQWHYRNTSAHPEEPILRAFDNINFGRREGYDAVLTWDGFPLPKFQNGVESYPNPRRPTWPEAEFIVGNPPFIGGKDIRSRTDPGYAEALWAAHPQMNESADYVMYWWDRAAGILTAAESKLRRFGLVTTNSISQVFQRRVIERHLAGKTPLCLVFAIPDQPWTKATKDSAAVRIAMTVAQTAPTFGTLMESVSERDIDTDEPKIEFKVSMGRINADLSVGVDVTKAVPLLAGEGLCSPGVKLHGAGFIVTPAEAALLGLGKRAGLERHIRPYRNGRDLAGHSRDAMVIDLLGLSADEVRQRYPEVYQHLLTQVKPERDQNNRETYKNNWWVFGEPRRELRPALDGLNRYIATIETSQHRTFLFLDGSVLPDNKLIVIASGDGAHLAILSSRTHLAWTSQAGALLEDRPVYVKTSCFDPFPFPDPPEPLKAKLRALGEELDSTRKRVQAEHPDLTLTGLYNVLEKVKASAELTPADEDVKTRGLVLVLKDLHDRIDAATAEAYGWPADLSDEQILERLVALNAERTGEEAQGFVRWLRPDYQIPRFAKDAPAPKSGDLDLEDVETKSEAKLPDFPKDRYEQPLALEAALAAFAQPVDAAGAARLFKGKASEARQKRIAEVLTTLARYGRVIALEDGRYAARRAA